LIPLEGLEESPLLAMMEEDVMTSHGNTTQKKKNKTSCLLLRVDGLKKTGTLFRGSFCYIVLSFVFDMTTKINFGTQQNFAQAYGFYLL